MIDEATKHLAQQPNFATLSTLMPDGQPQTQVMWVDADDEHILINTEVGRQKWDNVERDPRVTVTVIDRENPYHYSEVRGRVVEIVRGDVAGSTSMRCPTSTSATTTTRPSSRPSGSSSASSRPRSTPSSTGRVSWPTTSTAAHLADEDSPSPETQRRRPCLAQPAARGGGLHEQAVLTGLRAPG